MRNPCRALLLLPSVLACVAVDHVVAQTEKAEKREKITLPGAPKPGSAHQYRMSQDIEMEMTFEGTPPGGAQNPGPMKMAIKNVVAMTQKTGMPDAEGLVSSEMTYDDFTTEATVNGTAVPSQDTGKTLVGQKLITVFNSKGEVVDVKIPQELGPAQDAIKQMLKGLYANLPTKPIGIGETAMMPFEMALPLPIPGAEGTKIEGQTEWKLVSLERDAEDPLAVLDQTMEAKLASAIAIPSPTETRPLNINFKLTGNGRTQLNLTRGMVKDASMRMTMDGRLESPSAPDDTGNSFAIVLRGTISSGIVGTPLDASPKNQAPR